MSTLPNAAETRTRIAFDHDRLRAIMRRVSASAAEALREEQRRPWLRGALAELRCELERHLEYEETFLVPILAQADAWGPVRAEHLLKDHVGQRTLVVALTEDASDGVRTIDALVEEIEWFVQTLERDMRDEEANFLSDEALGEELFVVDQIDG
jgi:hypothetical protein